MRLPFRFWLFIHKIGVLPVLWLFIAGAWTYDSHEALARGLWATAAVAGVLRFYLFFMHPKWLRLRCPGCGRLSPVDITATQYGHSVGTMSLECDRCGNYLEGKRFSMKVYHIPLGKNEPADAHELTKPDCPWGLLLFFTAFIGGISWGIWDSIRRGSYFQGGKHHSRLVTYAENPAAFGEGLLPMILVAIGVLAFAIHSFVAYRKALKEWKAEHAKARSRGARR